nr:threonine/serine exporter family protein [Cellulomonas denverensis]
MVLVAVLVLVAAAAGLVWLWRTGALGGRRGAVAGAVPEPGVASRRSGVDRDADTVVLGPVADGDTAELPPVGGGVDAAAVPAADAGEGPTAVPPVVAGVDPAAVPPVDAGVDPAAVPPVAGSGTGTAGGPSAEGAPASATDRDGDTEAAPSDPGRDPVAAGAGEAAAPDGADDTDLAHPDPAHPDLTHSVPATAPAEAAPVTGVIAVATVDDPHETLPRAAVPQASEPTGTADPEQTVRFLVRLGEAMVNSSSPIAQVNGTLERIAVVNGLPGTAVVTFPTALMVSVPDGRTVRTAVATAGSQTLRLDQIADVLDLAQSAVRGDTTPEDGLDRLATVLDSPPPSTGRRRALGYVVVAAGLSLVLGGGWLDVLIAAVLGGLVSVVTHLTRRMPAVYQGLLTGACAFLVAVPVFLLVRTGLPVGLLAPLIGPLVTFLPGALLTTGVIDLATRQMIAGSARLASGVMQLVLLGLGITAAAGLVGVPATEFGAGGGHPLGWAAPWLGVLVYAVGVVLNNDARPGALPWIALVLVVAYAGQVVGGLLLGTSVSSFVGALAMTPVAMIAATRPSAPPFLVTFLPGFWVLVPGALGLVGVTSALDQVTDQTITTIVTAGVSMVTICLGVLAGLALGSGLQRRLAPDMPPLI